MHCVAIKTTFHRGRHLERGESGVGSEAGGTTEVQPRVKVMLPCKTYRRRAPEEKIRNRSCLAEYQERWNSSLNYVAVFFDTLRHVVSRLTDESDHKLAKEAPDTSLSE